jgi:hypothetical protein
MPQGIVNREIGSVIADESSPSFDTFRFKANANEYVYPGTLVGTSVDENKFLIGRVPVSLEKFFWCACQKNDATQMTRTMQVKLMVVGY